MTIPLATLATLAPSLATRCALTAPGCPFRGALAARCALTACVGTFVAHLGYRGRRCGVAAAVSLHVWLRQCAYIAITSIAATRFTWRAFTFCATLATALAAFVAARCSVVMTGHGRLVACVVAARLATCIGAAFHTCIPAPVTTSIPASIPTSFYPSVTALTVASPPTPLALASAPTLATPTIGA